MGERENESKSHKKGSERIPREKHNDDEREAARGACIPTGLILRKDEEFHRYCRKKKGHGRRHLGDESKEGEEGVGAGAQYEVQ